MVVRAYHLGAINVNQYQYLMRQISQNGWRTNEPLDDFFPLRHPKALKQAVNLILLNNVLSGNELISEIKRGGMSLPKSVVDEVLNLDPETIVIDENDTKDNIIQFVELKRP